MDIRARITAISSTGGDRVETSESGVTCIVGGNNAGKSQTLRDIQALLWDVEAPSVVLRKLEVSKPILSSSHDIEQFLRASGSPQGEPTPGFPQAYTPIGQGGSQLTAPEFLTNFNSGPDAVRQARDFIVSHSGAGSLAYTAVGPLGHIGTVPGTSPLHRLYRDGDLESELSDLAHEVFGERLVLDRANANVQLRVGEVTVEVPLLSRPTLEYADALAALPTLNEQGDGVKSFIGLALSIVAGGAQILLIDEPEAFLHPGQARALGRWLSHQASARDLQIIVATHDRDFVLGLLDGKEDSVRVVRVVRRANSSRLYELAPQEVSAAWADPVLRYSNILQGLFHRRVAVCESDSDCRFYGAVLDELANETGRRSEADDVLLVPSGGKKGVAKLARSLVKLDVETHALVDFDVFREKRDIREIVEALEGSWSDEMDEYFRTFVRPVQDAKLWDRVKELGLVAVPSGSAHNACQRLLTILDALRVHVVPGGEIESFDRSNGMHGPAWVTSALMGGIHQSSQPAKDYVGKLLIPQVAKD